MLSKLCFLLLTLCQVHFTIAQKSSPWYRKPADINLVYGMETESSGYGPENTTQHSGYIAVNKANKDGAHIFYWLFEARNSPETAPLVLWLTGGPGCSSELAIFYENGPYNFDAQGNIVRNDFSWNTNANVLYVDQPVGTGFSYAETDADYVRSEAQVAQDMYEFLQTFYAQYPQYQSAPFFVTGESYAGHYVPSIAHRIFTANAVTEGPFTIPLTGFAIGNGLVNPRAQYNDYHTYMYDNGFLTASQTAYVNDTLVPRCMAAIDSGDNLRAFSVCNAIDDYILARAGNVNVYDIRKECVGSLCYDFSAMDKLMQRRDVKDSLGVSNRAEWAECDSTVYSYLEEDWMVDCSVGIPEMLEAGVRVLVYSGVEDFICNWYGGRHWVHDLEWSGSVGYRGKTPRSWISGGVEAGMYVEEGALTFLSVKDAGHMVPMDAPEAALDMLTRFIEGKSFGEDVTAAVE